MNNTGSNVGPWYAAIRYPDLLAESNHMYIWCTAPHRWYRTAQEATDALLDYEGASCIDYLDEEFAIVKYEGQTWCAEMSWEGQAPARLFPDHVASALLELVDPTSEPEILDTILHKKEVPE